MYLVMVHIRLCVHVWVCGCVGVCVRVCVCMGAVKATGSETLETKTIDCLRKSLYTALSITRPMIPLILIFGVFVFSSS